MKAIAIGLIVCDILVKPVDRGIFDRDTTMIGRPVQCAGGDALNVCCVLSRLGIPVSLIGKVGQDGFGDYVLQEAESSGVDISHVVREEEVGTSTSIILIEPDGERHFAFHHGASGALRLEDVDFTLFEGADVVSVNSVFGLPALEGEALAILFRAAKKAGAKTVLDLTGATSPTDLTRIDRALREVDYFIPNLDEAMGLTGTTSAMDAAEALLGHGPTAVIIKMGDRGCLYTDGSKRQSMTGFAVETVDTTGAGDCFVGGFITGLIKGLPIEGCLEMGNATGSLSVTEIGATQAVCSFEQVEAYIEGCPRYGEGNMKCV